MRLGILGVDQQRRHELDERLFGAILLHERCGEILVHRPVIRIRRDGARERRDSAGNIGRR